MDISRLDTLKFVPDSVARGRGMCRSLGIHQKVLHHPSRLRHSYRSSWKRNAPSRNNGKG
jgi:hypothetical protein